MPLEWGPCALSSCALSYCTSRATAPPPEAAAGADAAAAEAELAEPRTQYAGDAARNLPVYPGLRISYPVTIPIPFHPILV